MGGVVSDDRKLLFAVDKVLESPRLRTAGFEQDELALKIADFVGLSFCFEVSDLDAT